MNYEPEAPKEDKKYTNLAPLKEPLVLNSNTTPFIVRGDVLETENQRKIYKDIYFYNLFSKT
jgi:hypothetical protein